MTPALTTTNHDRDIAGLKYVYPVISRRAGGLSIGINFNTNNACNWRCLYCQVPELMRGSAPELDFALLEDELRFLLNDVLHGNFYERFQIASDHRVIKDIAVSGNGEPTSVNGFAEAIDLIGAIASELAIFPDSRFVLITNGSLIHQDKVQAGLRVLNNFGGEVWFKFDSATDVGRTLFNNAAQSVEKAMNNIKLSAELCSTKLQTCVFGFRDAGFSENEQSAYLDAIKVIGATTTVRQILLYTLARSSMQPEAAELSALPHERMEAFAEKIRRLGFTVSVSA